MSDHAFFNKQYMPLSEAKVGIMTHALNYGTACFEGIRGNWNADENKMYIFRMEDHYVRLKKNCGLLKINIAYSVEELCQITTKLAGMNNYKEDFYIRPMAYKSSEAVGVKLHGLEDDFFIFTVPFGPYLDIEKGAKCGVSSWRRVDDNMIPPRGKITGIYVNSAIAKTEAHENGYDEAILLNQDGSVSEGSGENIFLIMDGKIHTPPASDNILLGITRDTVIKIAKNEMGIDTVQRSIARSELYMADECFMTGTAAHLTPIIEIDHRKVGTGEAGEISKKLQKIYFDILQGKNPDYMDWCTPVPVTG